MSILDRLNIIRKDQRLNKAQLEKLVGKSSGYYNTLEKRGSDPGVDVIVKLTEAFPDYNIEWIINGSGNKIKTDKSQSNLKGGDLQSAELSHVVLGARDEVRADLKVIYDGLVKNFETLSKGVLRLNQGQTKLLDFIGELDTEQINRIGDGLEDFLKEKV